MIIVCISKLYYCAFMNRLKDQTFHSCRKPEVQSYVLKKKIMHNPNKSCTQTSIMWTDVCDVEKRQWKGIAEEKEYFLLSFSFSQCHLSFHGGEEVVKRRKYVGPLLPHVCVYVYTIQGMLWEGSAHCINYNYSCSSSLFY